MTSALTGTFVKALDVTRLATKDSKANAARTATRMNELEAVVQSSALALIAELRVQVDFVKGQEQSCQRQLIALAKRVRKLEGLADDD